jgi:putative (di)nucleoside polyphosphate hydrolase
MITQATSLPYRPCVGIMLLNRDDRVFTARRIDQAVEAWQMPQGGIDAGEAPLPAALRELEEEISVPPGKVTLLHECRDWLTYDLPTELIGKAWKGKYRGQRQKWFAFRFDGQDSDINIDTRHPEFEAWRWQDMRTLPDMIVPFKQALYEKLVAEFSFLLADDRSLKRDG